MYIYITLSNSIHLKINFVVFIWFFVVSIHQRWWSLFSLILFFKELKQGSITTVYMTEKFSVSFWYFEIQHHLFERSLVFNMKDSNAQIFKYFSTAYNLSSLHQICHHLGLHVLPPILQKIFPPILHWLKNK